MTPVVRRGGLEMENSCRAVASLIPMILSAFFCILSSRSRVVAEPFTQHRGAYFVV